MTVKNRLAVHAILLPLRFPCGLIIFSLVIFFAGLGNVQAENGKDEIFGGQILSLTEEKPKLEPSNDPRFKDNNDGTVTDITRKG